MIGSALPASPGAAAGKVYFTADEAKLAHERGERVVLVRLETSPEDIEGMHAAEGILTARGGMTSHAAVVARGMGTCCVSGCGEIKMNEDERYFELGGETVKEGDYISLDGTTGRIYLGDIRTKGGRDRRELPADHGLGGQIPPDAGAHERGHPGGYEKAVELGAEGIGLCRTEHMFFEPERIPKIRKMILSDTPEAREAALRS